MKKIVYITVSPRGTASFSRTIGQELVDRLIQHYSDCVVINRDLALHPIPHLDAQAATLLKKYPYQNETPQDCTLLSNTLTQEILDADIIVLATPMWNYTVPSVLKAWLDYVIINGRTFLATAQGQQGLCTNKKAYFVVASGGFYTAAGAQSRDYETGYLQMIFAVMGIKDSTLIRVEGTLVPNNQQSSIESARKAVAALIL